VLTKYLLLKLARYEGEGDSSSFLHRASGTKKAVTARIKGKLYVEAILICRNTSCELV